MNSATVITASGPRYSQLSGMPSLDVLDAVISQAAGAVDVFQGRRLFAANGRRVCLVEYIDFAVNRIRPGLPTSVREAARDACLDRFMGLTPASRDRITAIHDRIRARIGQRNVHPFDVEHIVSEEFTRTVNGHLNLSLREAIRQSDEWSRRYKWTSPDDQGVWLRVPREIPSSRIRTYLIGEWLRRAEPPGDVKLWAEGRVDHLFRRRRQYSIEALGRVVAETPVHADEVSKAWEINDLAEDLAAEKADNLDRLPPSLRVLGANHVKELVKQIVEAIADGHYYAKSVAYRFGLSESTLSRWAGIRWANSQESRVPGLFKNLAGLLASSPRFLAAHRAVLRKNVAFKRAVGEVTR
jgi:hypothetical protein